MYFPTVRGYSLDGHHMTIPFTLEGEFNVLLVVFEPSHQFSVQTWLRPLKRIRQQYERVKFYEIPTLEVLPPSDQQLQDQNLRESFVIEDELSLETVVTIYVRKQQFCTMLDIPHEDNLYVFLVDNAGVVLWRTEGTASVEKVDELTRLLDSVISTDIPWWMSD
ncbi:MAG: hypothetical protein DCC53_08435 [Chloroflexi bacterium]|nr:MAG: hypothetical protein UZ13_01946 [Chloroflexi bacterium OLB13]MBV6435887.1 hypothetical protein [Anaerolineae bacterium]OQY86851.1 MAG: hypothetical protein B6D42_00475 [Anaerolineae bacterium UTCFX5]RIK21021.1 MAG: hypothetical protein DCC53_08435 [Chloroflexota bacterium]GIK27593.1 MAG: hypothetical protein BroJett007_07310 [Chloroflexota bacterium]